MRPARWYPSPPKPSPATGSSNWTGSAVSAGKVTSPESTSTSVTVDGDYTLVANFEATGSTVRYSLTISTMGGAPVTPGFGLFTYQSVTVVSVGAQANSGYQFIE